MRAKLIERLQYDHLIVVAAVFIGFITGTHALSDNSALLHIRTGMSILDTHHVPHSDPYSFTAHGQPWTVESWLAELVYAVLIKVGGGHLLQLFGAAVLGATAGVTAQLSRTNNVWRTLLTTIISIGLGYALWTERPTALGLLLFALTVLVVTRRRHFAWLIPIGLVWVNMHASWPVGVLWIIAGGVGARLDRDNFDPYIKYAGALAAACIVGGLVSPAGLDILSFPQTAFGDRAAVFSKIAEWQSPNFASSDITGGRLVLVAFVLAVLILCRKRQTWAQLLPLSLLVVAALGGVRNLALFGVAIAPVLSSTLSTTPKLVDAGTRRLLVVGALVFTLCGALDLVPTYSKSAYNFSGYPVAAVNWMDQQGLIGPGHHVFTYDYVGCYMIYRYGDRANVFIDDRYDMYPVQVANDSTDLLKVRDSTNEILARYDIQAVLMRKDASLSQYLRVYPQWSEVWSDSKWAVFEPSAPPLVPAGR